ncbi:type III pantothenate kinase [Thiorhodovibrio winogradskyi]|uniref:type III pantothenate kinase n=1 Tax=Thiorhodovibrio winogradskyi TaxID=77007 RepID=UPI002E2D4AEE|nr:type III pantothenate kinase [Thiorhodovibrio winogradskyi]
MQLLIDIGNTSIKWALWDGTALSEMQRARHHGALPIDLLAAWEALESVHQVRICHVGPDAVKSAVTHIARTLWQQTPEFMVVDPSRSPVRIAYTDPSRLGIDRWLSLCAAHQLYPGPKLIMHIGTAITYDALLGDGQHLGGHILPGIEALRDSLLNTTQIPPQDRSDPNNGLWGNNTGQCIAAACLHAPAALADRLWHQLRKQTTTTPRLLITGGDAERISPLLTHPSFHHPDLVLQGFLQHPRHSANQKITNTSTNPLSETPQFRLESIQRDNGNLISRATKWPVPKADTQPPTTLA